VELELLVQTQTVLLGVALGWLETALTLQVQLVVLVV
jgi:hypothetical protein